MIFHGALTLEESYSTELILEEFYCMEPTFEKFLFSACGHLRRAATCNVRPLATCGHLQRAATCNVRLRAEGTRWL